MLLASTSPQLSSYARTTAVNLWNQAVYCQRPVHVNTALPHRSERSLQPCGEFIFFDCAEPSTTYAAHLTVLSNAIESPVSESVRHYQSAPFQKWLGEREKGLNVSIIYISYCSQDFQTNSGHLSINSFFIMIQICMILILIIVITIVYSDMYGQQGASFFHLLLWWKRKWVITTGKHAGLRAEECVGWFSPGLRQT